MTEEGIRLQARLTAIEYMLANLYSSFFERCGLSAEGVKAQNDELRQRLTVQAAPDVDPVLSDHLCGEFQNAVQAILTEIEAVANADGREV